MPEAVIVAAARTPIGRAFKGSLVDVRPDDLAATIIGAAMGQVPQLDPSEVEDVHLGCGLPGGEQGFNMARVVTTLLGWTTPGVTVTRYCSSSLQTTRMALHAIRAGEGDVFISAGVEMISRYVKGNSDSLDDTRNPRFADAEARTQRRSGEGAEPWVPLDELPSGLADKLSGEVSHGVPQGLPRGLPAERPKGLPGGLTESLPDIYIPMGQTAENLAQLKGVSREAMDDFAFRSQQRYAEATAQGFWAREITPITLPDGSVLDADESPRAADRAAMADLAPVFRPDGLVTAGNACPLNDGAAALVVMSDQKARQLGITPMARIVATSVSALDPEIMGYGPVEATRRVLDRAGMSIGDMDIVEINEAFAAQVLPCADDLGIDHDRLNPHGGAIAVGHPFGMTGARITTTLINGLRHTDGTFGLETMCVGGGQGMAMIIERLS
ncbi:MAG: acetyl-CoA C-acetyltransferase [Nitriliruptoraceae bacterium]